MPMRKWGTLGLIVIVSLVGCSSNIDTKEVREETQQNIETIQDKKSELADELYSNIQTDNQQKVVENYLEIKYHNLPELQEATDNIESYFNDKMEEAYEEFNRGEGVELETLIKEIDKMGIDTTITTEKANELIKSKENFEKALKYESNGELEKASELLSRVIQDDSNYQIAQEKLKVASDKYLEEVSKNTTQLLRDYKFKEALDIAETIHSKYNNSKSSEILAKVESAVSDFTNWAINNCIIELNNSDVDFEEILKVANAYNELVPDTDGYFQVTGEVERIKSSSNKYIERALESLIGNTVNGSTFEDLFELIESLEVGSQDILSIEDCYSMIGELQNDLEGSKYMLDNEEIQKYNNIQHLNEVIDLVISESDTVMDLYNNIGYMNDNQNVDERSLSELKNNIQIMRVYLTRAKEIHGDYGK